MRSGKSLEGVAVSWNGGKDATVLLTVLYMAAKLYIHELSQSKERSQLSPVPKFEDICAITFSFEQNFPEVVEFTKSTAEKYVQCLSNQKLITKKDC